VLILTWHNGILINLSLLSGIDLQSNYVKYLRVQNLLYTISLISEGHKLYGLAIWSRSGYSHRADTHRPQFCFPSTHTPRSRRMSPPPSKLSGAPGSRLRPPSRRSWLCGSTKELDCFVGEPPQTTQTWCSLHSKLLLTWPPHRPRSVLVLWSKPTNPASKLRLLAATQHRLHVHDFILFFLPPCDPHLISFGYQGPSNKPTCLSTTQRPRKAKTFCTNSSPAPTQIKTHHEPTILGQESVHTMFSITHD
jgi:hypothetical protein